MIKKIVMFLIVPVIMGISGGPGVVGAEEIEISWDEVTVTDLDRYKIYQNGSLFVTVPKENTSYTFSLITEGIHTFRIAAVDVTGNELDSCEVMTITIDHTAPPCPTNPVLKILQ